MVAVLILNWNGWRDTIECLQSMRLVVSDEYFIVVGDNGSSDKSIQHIGEYVNQVQGDSFLTSIRESKIYPIKPRDIILFDIKDNTGFARGNNILIQYASGYRPEHYLLLNNDTIVEPDFMMHLIAFHQKNPSYKVLTPLIHYYDNRDLIWNGGGNLIWGGRRYHYAGQFSVDVKEKEYINCTFITGCALFFEPSVLFPDGTLLTEKFYFGEEDFEFCHRMKKESTKMACVVKSVIYHKVGQSSLMAGSSLGLTFVHYLNRFIDLHCLLRPISYCFFIFCYTPYLLNTLIKKGISIKDALHFYARLMIESHKYSSVSRELFLSIISYYDQV